MIGRICLPMKQIARRSWPVHDLMKDVGDRGLDHIDEVFHHVVGCFLLVFVESPPHGG